MNNKCKISLLITKGNKIIIKRNNKIVDYKDLTEDERKYLWILVEKEEIKRCESYYSKMEDIFNQMD